MIEVACLGCGKQLKAKDELAGKRVKCHEMWRYHSFTGWL